MPHRAYVSTKSLLKKPSPLLSKGARRVSVGSAHIKFADGRSLVSTTVVASYRDLNEQLWFTNPQANVLCERCKRRVPQKQGQLRGGVGRSSFMCDEFLCGECVDSLQ